MAHGDKGKVLLGGSDGESPHGDKGKVFLGGSDGESPHVKQMKSLPWWKRWWKSSLVEAREKSCLVEAREKFSRIFQEVLIRDNGKVILGGDREKLGRNGKGKSPPWWRQGKSSRKAGTQWEREKSSLVEAKGKVLQKTLRRYGGLSFRLSKSKRERQGKTDWRGKVAD